MRTINVIPYEDIALYLDWVNNFLTIDAMAEHYDVDSDWLRSKINGIRNYYNPQTLKGK